MICIGNNIVSSAIWKKKQKTRTSEFFKYTIVYIQMARETMLLLINNVHDKIMQNWVIGLSHVHVQNSLFTSDCQYFHNKKAFVRTADVKQCVLITEIVKIAQYFLFGTVFP